jgi:hypothetical protein
MVSNRGLSDQVDVIHAPLRDYEIEGQHYQWYTLPDGVIGKESIELLIIDGPPTQEGEKARYPAVPVLEKYLSDDCVILLDDGKRPQETVTAEKWSENSKCDITYVDNAKGAWVIEINK